MQLKRKSIGVSPYKTGFPPACCKSIIESARRIADTRPNRNYSIPEDLKSGSYIYGKGGDGKGGEGCLLGRAIMNVGFSRLWLVSVEAHYHPRSVSIRAILEIAGIPADSDQLEWLCDLQYYNDRGNNWGNCVKQADLLAGLRKRSNALAGSKKLQNTQDPQ